MDKKYTLEDLKVPGMILLEVMNHLNGEMLQYMTSERDRISVIKNTGYAKSYEIITHGQHIPGSQGIESIDQAVSFLRKNLVPIRNFANDILYVQKQKHAAIKEVTDKVKEIKAEMKSDKLYHRDQINKSIQTAEDTQYLLMLKNKPKDKKDYN